MPAKRDEIGKQTRPIDPRPAIADLHARIIGLAGHGAHRTEEARAERFVDRRAGRGEPLRRRRVVVSADSEANRATRRKLAMREGGELDGATSVTTTGAPVATVRSAEIVVATAAPEGKRVWSNAVR